MTAKQRKQAITSATLTLRRVAYHARKAELLDRRIHSAAAALSSMERERKLHADKAEAMSLSVIDLWGADVFFEAKATIEAAEGKAVTG